MTSTTPSTHIAFYGASLVASGLLDHVAVTVHALSKPQGEVTVLDAVTSHVVDLDLRGSADDVRERYAPAGDEPERADEREMPPEPKRRGRPKLGVVSREVTLLPRHWEWLSGQRGGASVTLRRLVDAARKAGADEDRRRLAQESVYRFMSTIAGDEPGSEEATRALYRGDVDGFMTSSQTWPSEVRAHARELASGAFA